MTCSCDRCQMFKSDFTQLFELPQFISSHHSVGPEMETLRLVKEHDMFAFKEYNVYNIF